MLQEIDLRELAERHGPERAYVSLYIGGEEGLRALKRREERVRALLEEDDEREHFERGLELVRSWIEESWKGGPACVFACWAEDFLRGYELSVAPPDVLRIGPAPYLRPLAELQEEHEKYVVVAANNRATRILTVDSAEPRERQRVRGDVKNRVKKGGWSQQRYARRREKELHHYAQEIAEVLRRLAQEEGYGRIVLLGSGETLGELERCLPESVEELVVAREGADLKEGDAELLEHAAALDEEEERRTERDAWRRIQDQYLSDGLAAVGAEDVLAAALVGRVETMLVTRDLELPGRRCGACDNLFAGEPERCAACGEDELFEVELVDALVRQLELTSAEVDFVDRIPGLSKVGDVAALLRY